MFSSIEHSVRHLVYEEFRLIKPSFAKQPLGCAILGM